MRAFMLEAPEELLAERRRTGADKRDEVWEGVLHMVPPAAFGHQSFASELFGTLRPLAKAKGLVPLYETGLFRPGSGMLDYRVPDMSFALPSQCTDAGLEGAELVVEVLSPGDESYDKLGFFADRKVREVVIANPATRAVEMFVLRGGKLHAALPDDAGVLRSAILGAAFATTTGRKLLVTWADGEAAI